MEEQRVRDSVSVGEKVEFLYNTKDGDRVEAGDLVASIRDDNGGAIYLKAPASGVVQHKLKEAENYTVKNKNTEESDSDEEEEGSTVNSKTLLFTISTDPFKTYMAHKSFVLGPRNRTPPKGGLRMDPEEAALL